MIASTDPVASSTPNSSRASSVVSRRETRFRTASVTTAACSRGPNAERGTLAGSSARVWVAHSGQQTACSRCSLTRTAIGGNSATWCRDGSAASTRSRSSEQVRARPAALRPMLDDLVDLLERKQPPMPALMPRLATTSPTRPLPARTRRRRRRILRRRQRRVPRTPVQPPLELGHPSLEPLVRLHQLAHPQQQRDSRLTITIKDRLRLSPLHTTGFAAGTGSLPQPERLPRRPRFQGLFEAGDGVRTHDPQLGKLMLYQLSYARWRDAR